MNPNKIFIYGVPGAGKTTLSQELQKELGYPLVEADELRSIAQKEYSEAEKPFLYLPTTDAFKYFGEFSEENIIKGLQEVRTALTPYVEAEISKHPDTLIMESAFLNPFVLKNQGQLILIATSDEQKHSNQFFEHRKNNGDTLEKFRSARIIQNYLLEEAHQNGVIIIENSSSMENLMKKIQK
jgi:2-phosphoglycerate kinase